MLKSDEFVLVSKKDKMRKRSKQDHKLHTQTRGEEVAHLGTRVDDCLREIKSSQFYTDLLDSLKRCSRLLKTTLLKSDRRSVDVVHEQGTQINEVVDFPSDSTMNCDRVQYLSDERLDTFVGDIEEIVCYGLGNFSSCVIARYQLSLLMALREKIQVDLRSCHFYDPRFTETEKKFIEGTGMTLVDKNEECKRPCKQTTLFFMPHCDKPLYNNLLYSNWSPSLEKIIIIGNSFNSTVQSLSKRVLHAEGAYISKIAPYTEEVPIANTFRFLDIFNDTSIHCFPSHKLRDISPLFWENPIEPTYDTNHVGIVLTHGASTQ